MPEEKQPLIEGKTESPKAVSPLTHKIVPPDSNITQRGATEAPQAVTRPVATEAPQAVTLPGATEAPQAITHPGEQAEGSSTGSQDTK